MNSFNNFAAYFAVKHYSSVIGNLSAAK